MKALSIVLLALVLVGCASPGPLERPLSIGPSDAVVVDTRTQAQRDSRRDSIFSAVMFVGEDRLTPRPADLLVDALVTRSAATLPKPIRIEIDQFSLVDHFPNRLQAGGGQGWLGALLFETLVSKNTDWSFVQSVGVPRSADAIVCVFVGRINGTPVKIATFEPYKVSPFAGLIINDPDFRRAIDVAINRAASGSLEQLPK